MKKVFIILILIIVCVSVENTLLGQTSNTIKSDKPQKLFVELYLGTQVSGIRKEDYVASNYAPYIQLSAGKWIHPSWAIALNYQGLYFNFIGDNFKHKYGFLGVDVSLNLNSIIAKHNKGIWQVHIFGGPGLLYNDFYQKVNLCLNGGIINEFIIKNGLSLKFKVSGIASFKIYQHDKDILPNLSLGISKQF